MNVPTKRTATKRTRSADGAALREGKDAVREARAIKKALRATPPVQSEPLVLKAQRNRVRLLDALEALTATRPGRGTQPSGVAVPRGTRRKPR